MRRFIMWFIDHWFMEELSDACCRGYAKGYLGGLADKDTRDYLTGEELREYLKVGGTD